MLSTVFRYIAPWPCLWDEAFGCRPRQILLATVRPIPHPIFCNRGPYGINSEPSSSSGWGAYLTCEVKASNENGLPGKYCQCN